MRRFFSFIGLLIKIALLTAAIIWVYLHPGTIHIDWQDKTIDTTVGFAALILSIVFFAFAGVYYLWRRLLNMPHEWRRHRHLKSLELGYRALNKGLLAVAGNDQSTADRQAKKALQLLPDTALTYLLAAQAAQLRGDDIASDAHLAKLAQHPDGQLFGLKGQLTRALQRDDHSEALRLSRVAYAEQPTQPWIIDAAVQLEARQRNWVQVEKILRAAIKQAAKSDTADITRWKRDLGAGLLALSDEAKNKNDTEAALECAAEALKKNPGWTPAALRVADIWNRKAYRRRAQKILQNAWEIAPHPDLVRAWLGISGGERTNDTASTLEKLIGVNSNNAESAIAMAEIYRQSRLWGVARQHALKALEYRADRAAYRLLADIEQGDSGNAEKVRGWLEKASEAAAEPQWICSVTQERFDTWQVLNRRNNFNTIEWTLTSQQNVAALEPKNLLPA